MAIQLKPFDEMVSDEIVLEKVLRIRLKGRDEPRALSKMPLFKSKVFYGHIPVIVKMAVMGSKGGWKLATI